MKKHQRFSNQCVVKMPWLTQNERQQAIGMLRAGMSKRAVARQLNCHLSTISCLDRRLKTTGSASDRPRSGQPRVTTRRQDATISKVSVQSSDYYCQGNKRTSWVNNFVKFFDF